MIPFDAVGGGDSWKRKGTMNRRGITRNRANTNYTVMSDTQSKGRNNILNSRLYL